LKTYVLAFLAALTLVAHPAHSQEIDPYDGPEVQTLDEADTDGFDDLNPFDPSVETTLEMMDSLYEMQTGQSAHLPTDPAQFYARQCYRQTCTVWIHIYKPTQTAYLYINGVHSYSWLVSTGTPGRHETPRFDQHPNGRIYDRHTSSKYPGGDWNGMGNMPYAVFIYGGFAIHGTGYGNQKKLGTKASHGCIRLHPDNAFIFNRLVRQYGIYNTWITVE
jgi:hypothetical protein